ncbi:MAG: DUF2478 domain-containing protein [Chloroflexi bacterium]|jgi:nucleoside-triphosphatase|nr:nucleoside-triphosphatase [Anaerolineaceae bacterium]NMB90697.1 DUF2478 domain-containing protein [Chloroflexota bacterium]
MNAPIWLITGDRGAGKTTLCRMLIDAAHRAGWRVGGLLSPPVLEGRERVAIDVEDLRKGERRRLASLAQPGTPGEVHTCRWAFDAATLAWGDQALRQALPCDLLVIDELGPLEFERGQGWTSAFAALEHAGAYRMALVVVRPELLAAARRRWPQAEILTLMAVEQTPSLAASLEREFFTPTRTP